MLHLRPPTSVAVWTCRRRRRAGRGFYVMERRIQKGAWPGGDGGSDFRLPVVAFLRLSRRRRWRRLPVFAGAGERTIAGMRMFGSGRTQYSGTFDLHAVAMRCVHYAAPEASDFFYNCSLLFFMSCGAGQEPAFVSSG